MDPAFVSNRRIANQLRSQAASQMDRFMKTLLMAAANEMKPGGILDYVLASARRP
jgi:hypothetical protein